MVILKQLLGVYYLLATMCGFVLGLIVTYILSNKLVFGKPKDNKVKLFIMFALIGLIGLGILSLIVWILTGKLGLNYILSKTIATFIVFLWNFFARKLLYDSVYLELPYEL